MSTKYFKHETAIIGKNARIGDNTKIWHWTHINEDAIIGANSMLGQNVYVGSKAIIGNGVRIQNNVSVFDYVIIEDDVFCGPSVTFTNVNNPRAFVDRKTDYVNTIVQKGATLGANSTILCGVTIGQYALIGAGAVITKDVKPHALMVGVPAKQVGWVSHLGEVLDDSFICPMDGTIYNVQDDSLVIKSQSRINDAKE